jgi:hypothetical protein
MTDRTPIDLVGISALSALGTLALVFIGWTTVDSWMRRQGRVV